MIPEIEAQIGASLSRIVADRGYRGHNAPPDHRFKVYISGQKRGVTEAIKRDLRRRSAVEPVIGHAKTEHRMGRNFLKGTHGDVANAMLAAAGYNFRRLLAWLAALWLVFIMALLVRRLGSRPRAARRPLSLKALRRSPKRRLLHGRLPCFGEAPVAEGALVRQGLRAGPRGIV